MADNLDQGRMGLAQQRPEPAGHWPVNPGQPRQTAVPARAVSASYA
jgi:hypothetical protein